MDRCNGRGGSEGGSWVQDGVGCVDPVHHLANVAHWSQVALVEQDADGSAVSGQDFDLGVPIKWVCCPG